MSEEKTQWVPKVMFWGDKMMIVYPFGVVYAPKVDPMKYLEKKENA